MNLQFYLVVSSFVVGFVLFVQVPLFVVPRFVLLSLFLVVLSHVFLSPSELCFSAPCCHTMKM